MILTHSKQWKINRRNQEQCSILLSFYTSVADPERFDADPDPSLHADAEPDPNILARSEKNISAKSSTVFSKILQNLACVIFSVTMREDG